ncbi:MAG: hypothetical protein HY864_00755 [Chloroflexi bacterium]|nr:hypothetical protein [Chloroflexota bacterium]
MTIRSSPTEPNPTHHVKLTDKNGNSVGLILCNDKGEAAPVYSRTPVDRTALKTQSGSSKYSDFNYPYSPIVQDDWSGGRGNLDFERDSTKYFDGCRVNTRHENKAFLGPRMNFSKGHKTIDYPAFKRNLAWFDFYATGISIIPTVSFTVGRIWIYTAPLSGGEPITVNLKLTASPYTTIATGNVTADHPGGWLAITMTGAVTAGTQYTLKPMGSPWNVLYQSDSGWQGLYSLEAAVVERDCIYYEYKGQQYKVLSPASGAPTVWMNGDRGAADSNAGQLTKLIDATKAWTVNEHVGKVVKIVQGTGKAEKVQYRTITSNTATELISSAWTIQHDTTTEYVILGSEEWRELTGHGLTVPVTAVLPVGEVVYFAQGDSVLMRSHREYNNAGVWSEANWRAEAANYALHLAYQPLANKIWRSQNSDATGIVSVSSASPAAAYGTDLTFAAVIEVGDKYSFINGMQVYPNDSGLEALWVYKEDIPYIVTTTAEPIKLNEMSAMRSRTNGSANLTHNVYSYFSMGQGLERYYGGNVEDLGPNLGEGLPSGRQGNIISLLGYPGRFFAIVDAWPYSSLLERSGGGWHEVYRAPYGERLKALALQIIPGSTVDRMWLWQGDISVYVHIASGGKSELESSDYRFAPDGEIITSWFHAGLFDTQKLIRAIKIVADNLSYHTSDDLGLIDIGVDYRLQDDDAWTALAISNITPASGPSIKRDNPGIGTVEVAIIDLSSTYGLAGKAMQLRLRFFSSDSYTTPILKATVIEAVLRSQVKYIYNLTFRVMDDEPSLAPREMDEDSVTAAGMSAITKLAQLEAWADADTEGLLYMESESPLYNGKYVFINPPNTRQVAVNPDTGREWTGDVFVCSTTAQEA